MARITCDIGRVEEQMRILASEFLDKTEWNSSKDESQSAAVIKKPEFEKRIEPLPVAVNFTSRAFPAVSYKHKHSASLQVSCGESES